MVLLFAAVTRLLLFWGRLTGQFGGVHHDYLKDNVAFDQCLFAWQSELAGAQQGVLNSMNDPANGGLTETLGLTDMGLGAVLAPVHQRDQEPVLQAMGGGASAGG